MRALISTLIAVTLGAAALAAQVAYAQQPPAAGAPKAAARQAEFAGKSGAELNEALQPIVDKAGRGCKVANAKILGAATGIDLYEVACDNGIGGLIQVTVPRTATSAVSLTTCLTLNTEATGPKCSLTTAETNTAAFSTLASKAEKPCTVTNQRFVGATADGSHYFEYACSDSSGFMLKADLSAAYKGQTSCLQATSLAGGCTLTNAAAAIAEIQTRLGAAIRTAGATCSVDRFGEFAPREDSDFKATEVTCKDRPESLVVLQTDAKTSVLNCARARAEGWSCGMSQSALAWPALSNDLARATGVQKNYSDCEVNGSSGSYSLRSVYVEVTCKDGAPGFMIQYPRGESKPSEIYTCGQAVGIGGGCKMAANQPK